MADFNASACPLPRMHHWWISKVPCPPCRCTDSAEKGTEWWQNDAKTASIIACTLSKSVAELILTSTSAKDIWDKLCAQFEHSSTQRLNVLSKSFFQAQWDCKEDITTHAAKLQQLFVDLTMNWQSTVKISCLNECWLDKWGNFAPQEAKMIKLLRTVRFRRQKTAFLSIFRLSCGPISPCTPRTYYSCIMDSCTVIITEIRLLVESAYLSLHVQFICLATLGLPIYPWPLSLCQPTSISFSVQNSYTSIFFWAYQPHSSLFS